MSLRVPTMLEAALVWDVPTLRRSNDPGAAALLKAFDSPLRDARRSPQGPDGALERVAVVVTLERLGEREAAEEVALDLVKSPDEAEELLGRLTLSWMPDRRDAANLDTARDLVRRVDDCVLRARLLTRLLAAAIEQPVPELAHPLLTEALKAAPERTHLRAVLQQVGFNLLGTPMPSDWGPFDPDPLVNQPWISVLVADAAHDRAQEAVQERVRRTWTTVFHVGGSAGGSDLHAAELQASWAGALWLQPAIRQQLAAEVLLSEGGGPDRWSYALYAWAESGGRDLEIVAEYAEPRLDAKHLDDILTSLDARRTVRRRAPVAYIQVALALWDLLTPTRVTTLLRTLPETEFPASALSDAQQLWLVLSLRDPEAWTDHFTSQSEEVQRQVVSQAVTPGLVQLADRSVQDVLKPLVVDELASGTTTDHRVWAAAAGLMQATTPSPRERELMKSPPAWAVAEIVRANGELLDDSQLIAAIAELSEINNRELVDAREGRRGFGPGDTRIQLGRLLARQRHPDPDAMEMLRALVTDTSVHADMRFSALRAMTFVAVTHGLDARSMRALSDAPLGGAASPFGDVDANLLRAARAALRSTGDLDPHLQGELFALSRNGDRRVRRLIAEAIGGAVKRQASETLEVALLALLFDPEETVVQAALDAAAGIEWSVPGASETLNAQLRALYDAAGRHVRGNVVAVARQYAESTGSEQMRRLLARASRDDSWVVRREVSDPTRVSA